MRTLTMSVFIFMAAVVSVVPAVAEPIRLKTEQALDESLLLTVFAWLVILLFVAFLLLYLLKKYKTFNRINADYRHLEVTTSQFIGAGLKLHRVRYYQNEYLLVEKSNNLIQLDLSRGRQVETDQQPDDR